MRYLFPGLTRQILALEEQFPKALQDPGVQSTKGDLLIKYFAMSAYCGKLLKVWIATKFLTLRKTRQETKQAWLK